MSLFLRGRNTKTKRVSLGVAKLSEHHQRQPNIEGQPNMEGLIPIAMAVAFPDFLFSHRQSRPHAAIRYSPISTEQISARKVQSPSIALLLSTSLTIPLELSQGRGHES